MKNYHVQQIKREEARPWILTKHYARRMPSTTTYCFGLYKDVELVGICTFGAPFSNPLKIGICGPKYKSDVLELNRLCLKDNKKNEGSFLISRSYKLLPPSVLVSYADTEQGHIGYVYQSLNWLYTGLSVPFKDYYIEGKDDLHNISVLEEFRTDRSKRPQDKGHHVKQLREKYGDKVYRKIRSPKHRYVFFVGSKTQKKQMRKALRYPVLPYPKGESKRYDAGGDVPIQKLLFV